MSGAALMLVYILMAGAALLAIIRLLLGPSVPDRVVAADVLGIITTCALALSAAVFDSFIYLDIALVFAALSFVGVIAIARAIEPREGK